MAIESERLALVPAEIAILFMLLSMANSETGLAWPSYATLAKRTRIKVRHAKRSVASLVQRGLVEIVVAGDRVHSNRYRVNVAALREGGALQDTTQQARGSALQDTTQAASGSVLQDTTQKGGGVLQSTGWCPVEHDVVSCMTPDPIHDPAEHLAKQDHETNERSSGRRAGRASPADAQEAERAQQHLAFWSAWRCGRVKVDEVDALLDELLDGGHIAGGMDALLEGLARFAAYIDSGGKALTPLRWLEQRKWKDDWSPPASRKRRPKSASPSSAAPDLRAMSDSELDQAWDALCAAHAAHMYRDPSGEREVRCRKCVLASEQREDDRACSIGAPTIRRFAEIESEQERRRSAAA